MENLGWEPKTASELNEYFSYIKANESTLWVSTFRDVTKYLRIRQSAAISSSLERELITVTIDSPLDQNTYDIPVTVKTYIPEAWTSVELVADGQKTHLEILGDEKGNFVIYDIKLRQKERKLVGSKG